MSAARPTPPPVPSSGAREVLLPCPFCGAEPTLECLDIDDDDRAPRPHRVYRIECGYCDARQQVMSGTWWSDTKPPEDDNDRAARAQAIAAWNRRAPTTPTPETTPDAR